MGRTSGTDVSVFTLNMKTSLLYILVKKPIPINPDAVLKSRKKGNMLDTLYKQCKWFHMYIKLKL